MSWVRCLALLLLLGAVGCDDAADGEVAEDSGGSDVPGSNGQETPTGDDGDDPTSPGLEPPATGMPGQNPSTPSNDTPGGAAGEGPAAPGDAADMAGQDDDDAGTPDGCGTHVPCDASTPCSDSTLHCIVLPSCGRPACITPADACQLECGQPDCAILESYPEQVGCN